MLNISRANYMILINCIYCIFICNIYLQYICIYGNTSLPALNKILFFFIFWKMYQLFISCQEKKKTVNECIFNPILMIPLSRISYYGYRSDICFIIYIIDAGRDKLLSFLLKAVVIYHCLVRQCIILYKNIEIILINWVHYKDFEKRNYINISYK